jgi:hypothetical protein
MNDYKIEKNVPMADSPCGRGSRKKYPFDQMEVGDSFLILCKEGEEKRATSIRVSSSMYRYTFFGKRFSQRSVKGGIRIWRVA